MIILLFSTLLLIQNCSGFSPNLSFSTKKLYALHAEADALSNAVAVSEKADIITESNPTGDDNEVPSSKDDLAQAVIAKVNANESEIDSSPPLTFPKYLSMQVRLSLLYQLVSMNVLASDSYLNLELA